jgi:hypothetical protein
MDVAPGLVVIAGAWDGTARDFAAGQASADAVVLLPRDLSRPGWRFRLGGPDATIAAAGERRFRLAAAGGVLVRLAAVTPADLPHIHAEDRAYVAAELTAFLLAVLTRNDVPVLNRPTPQCLCGPAWPEAKWRRVAASLGLPVTPLHARAARDLDWEPPAEPAAARVAVVGETCIGAPNAQLARGAVALARRAAAAMLTVEFDGAGASAAVLRAAPTVDLADARIASAVRRLFGLADAPPQPAREGHRDPAMGA